MNNAAIIITAYQPNIKLIEMLVDLKKNDFSNIIIVDDGSDDTSAFIFTKAKELGCFVIKHHKNKGKGAALKAGIKFVAQNFGLQYGVITADADGQYNVCDIIKVAKALSENPHALILGRRGFNRKKAPLKSCHQSKDGSFIPKSATGAEFIDAQIGLCGIPANLIDTALKVEGSRCEYEYNFLRKAKKQTETCTVQIAAKYSDKNEQSNYHSSQDSILKPKRPVKIVLSLFVGLLTDIALFAAVFMVLSIYSLENIAVATAIARILSGFIYYVVNRNSPFGLNGKASNSILKYFFLFFILMGASAVGTVGVDMLLEIPLLSKIIVDTTLLFFSYSILKNWVFVLKMNKIQISKVWKSCAILFFIGYFSFTLLNRFVISQNVISLDDMEQEHQTEQNLLTENDAAPNSAPLLDNELEDSQSSDGVESEPTITEPIITETSYIDEDIQVEITTIREYDTDIYIAEIIVSDSSQLMAGLAENSFGTNVKEKTSVIAEDNDAIIAINGDYYGFRDYGYVMRNGYLYREISTAGGNEDLVIFQDGDMEIYNENDISAQELVELGATQIFSFGPGLISDGEIIVDEGSKVEREDESNPRTAIAMIAPNHYIFMVADGRTTNSEGLSLYEMAMVLSMYECEVAYNLDGGGSATMVFMGEVVNFPTTNGRDYKERSVSDIVYIGK